MLVRVQIISVYEKIFVSRIEGRSHDYRFIELLIVEMGMLFFGPVWFLVVKKNLGNLVATVSGLVVAL